MAIPQAKSKVKTGGSGPVPFRKPDPRAKALQEENSRLTASVDVLEQLVKLEVQTRECTTMRELFYHAANNFTALSGARQTMVADCSSGIKISAISGIASVERTSLTLRWLEEQFDNLDFKKLPAGTPVAATLDTDNAPVGIWPFQHVMAVKCDPAASMVVIFLGNSKFPLHALGRAEHVASMLAGSLRQLSPKSGAWKWLAKKKFRWLLSSVVALALFIPVPLTVLSPVEVVAHEPFVVAAPLGGVIEKIWVEPNSLVEKGQLLISYSRRDFENSLALAKQELQVAISRLRRAGQSSFGAGDGKREIAELRAEVDLAKVKVEHAQRQLETGNVKAEKPGVVLFSSRGEWTGKPVQTGERIMRISDPTSWRFLIRLPVSDAVMLHDAATARIFLNGAPLSPLAAKLERRSYEASSEDGSSLSYELVARSSSQKGESQMHVRIGERGTAQLSGSNVSLGYFVFRKPLSALRQYTGF